MNCAVFTEPDGQQSRQPSEGPSFRQDWMDHFPWHDGRMRTGCSSMMMMKLMIAEAQVLRRTDSLWGEVAWQHGYDKDDEKG